MAEWWEIGVDAGVKLATVVVNNIFAAKQKGAQPQLMSPGLAVGYYNNFMGLLNPEWVTLREG